MSETVTGQAGTQTPLVVDDPWAVACLEQDRPDIGTLWQLCMLFEFDRAQTVAGIADWLGPPAGQRILDSACGGGFPGIGLTALGYDIVCADGSELMLRHFRRNAALEGVTAEPQLVLWEDLPKLYADHFDVVVNRGGGNYKYAGAWDEDALPRRSAMAEAIGQWVACLRPGGRLYIDFAAPGESGADQPETRHPPLLVGGRLVEITERITVDPANGTRIWNSRLTVDGVAEEFTRRSHRLEEAEFLGILADCGVAEVERTAIPGERYEVFTGVKR